MALIECPECYKSISDTLKSCPSCGYMLHNQTAVRNSAQIIFLTVGLCLGSFGAVVSITLGNQVFGALGAVAVVISVIKLAHMG